MQVIVECADCRRQMEFVIEGDDVLRMVAQPCEHCTEQLQEGERADLRELALQYLGNIYDDAHNALSQLATFRNEVEKWRKPDADKD